MTETEFLNRVTEAWEEIESRVDRWAVEDGAEVEINRQGPVLEIEFDSGTKLIVNPQTPMQQIWLASPWGAFHFQWMGDRWQDTRSDRDFWQVLHDQASKAAGGELST